ncbi:hypothetical protein [Duganella vulcania]|uniref:Class I SAM-dependent methyltransferase n=1 Tax=Duganella vulcania TaxID=2692166 RepID=A0A845GDM2_9BURK|nr:hypothetical protein [Duganella vulcania]MYM92374.1 hypothetical protein [Duganella vulcania]
MQELYIERESAFLALPDTPKRVLGCYWSPSHAFLQELATQLAGKRVLEIFAGHGYLAAWLATFGVSVRPTTALSNAEDRHSLGFYHHVEDLGAVDAVKRYGAQADILLVCWPSVTNEVLRAAYHWGQDKPIVYIGEWTDRSKNQLAGCASDMFFDMVAQKKVLQSYRGNSYEVAAVCQLDPEGAGKRIDMRQFAPAPF